jgi:hypothetical protein
MAGRIPLRSIALTLSAALLGMALQLSDGLYSPVGLGVLTLSFILCIAAVLTPHAATTSETTPRGGVAPKTFVLFLALLIAVQLCSMLFPPAGANQASRPTVSQPLFQVGVGLAMCGLAMIAILRNPRWVVVGFLLMLVSFAGIGIWKIRSAPEPFIDVFVFHRDAAAALSLGINPYTITFPNIYGPDAYVYGPGVIQGDRLLFGYPYPPLVLLLTSGAQLLLGDPRYSMMLAMLGSAVMIALIRPDRIGMLVAAMFLFTPRAFYILELAWTEPISVMLLTATALFAVRAPKLMPVALGLLIVSKQYLPATLLLTPILLTEVRPVRRLLIDLVIACGVAALISLPLILWDFRAFWQSAITLQMRQPYRPDSLGYLAWWGYGRQGWTGPFWLCFVALFLCAILTVWRNPRGVGGFVTAFALTYYSFFVFNKQAFANYYYLVLGALCCAIVFVRENPMNVPTASGPAYNG